MIKLVFSFIIPLPFPFLIAPHLCLTPADCHSLFDFNQALFGVGYHLIFNNLQMQDKKSQIIHLYEFDQQSVNNKELTQRILEALEPYLQGNIPEIHIRGRPHKYWAYFEVDLTICEKLNQLKKIKIGAETLNIGTYYYDYQIFLKSIDANVPQERIEAYFSKFGEISHVVMTESFIRNGNPYRRCYIKMKDEKVVDSIVLGQVHRIDNGEVKCVRTFGLDQEKESYKKLFLIIQGDIPSTEELEQKAIEFFMKHGKIRERPRIEPTNNQKNKMIVKYGNHKEANSAIEAFPDSQWVKQFRQKGLVMKLNFFYTVENKVYAVGLKDVSEKNVEEAFSIFGEISEVKISKLKNGVVTATIGFTHEESYKMTLASFMEEQSLRKIFTGRPSVTIYMTPEERKSYYQMKKKKQNKPAFKPNNMSYGLGFDMNPQFYQYQQPMQNMPPPQFGQGFGGGFGQPPKMGMLPGKIPPPQQHGFPKNP